MKIPSEITPPLKLRAKKEVHQFLTIKIVKDLDEKLHIKAKKIPDSWDKYYYCGYCLEGQRWNQYQTEQEFKKVAKNLIVNFYFSILNVSIVTHYVCRLRFQWQNGVIFFEI